MASNAQTAGERLKALRARANLSMQSLAKAIGFAGASSYQRYEEAAESHLPAHLVKRLVPALVGKGADPIEDWEVWELTDEMLIVGPDKIDAAMAGLRAAEEGRPPTPDVSPPFSAEDQVGSKDLPVFASAEGGQGAMVITREPIEWVRRPEPLIGVKNAFACYVISDSMAPAYDHGDMILVHPYRPVSPNKDCLFISHHDDGGFDALVKRLLRAHPDRWRVRQYNPPRDFDLSRERWQQAMAIVGKYHGR